MCGILFILENNSVIDESTVRFLSDANERRGPDYSSPLLKHSTKCGLTATLKSSVLHLRGDNIQKQPVIDELENSLMFNGQIYKFKKEPLPTHESDTVFLAKKLRACQTKDQIVDVIASIDGPFAFVYWHELSSCIFYGRDIFGRKSLCQLRNVSTSELIVLSSVAAVSQLRSDNHEWSEVDCDAIHCVDFSQANKPMTIEFVWNLDRIYPRTVRCSQRIYTADMRLNEKLLAHEGLSPLNIERKQAEHFSLIDKNEAVSVLGQKLVAAISLRIKYNRETCLLCRRVSKLTLGVPKNRCDHSKVAVAFSGGIDSVMIALALDEALGADETIDLVTVAFKAGSPDRASAIAAFKELWSVRRSRNWRLVICDVTLNELQATRSQLIKDLILPCRTVIDDSLGCACWFVGKASGRAIESKYLTDRTMNSPELNSFLDYNLVPGNPEFDNAQLSYTSPASMLFVGSSIDEQLGGYSSHRSAWSGHGIPGLLDEVSFLMRRLSKRNLGRDDRCYSDHGRDLKLPYLDFDLVSYLNHLPIGLKMDFSEPIDAGPKKILRELARDWGLEETSRRTKKAMQFGSRIANLENAKEKASDTCSRLGPT